MMHRFLLLYVLQYRYMVSSVYSRYIFKWIQIIMCPSIGNSVFKAFKSFIQDGIIENSINYWDVCSCKRWSKLLGHWPHKQIFLISLRLWFNATCNLNVYNAAKLYTDLDRNICPINRAVLFNKMCVACQ
jgi:hypothetical protein